MTSPKFVSVSSSRGGTGKTVTSLALAYELAAFHGRRVGVLDLDGQGSLAAFLGLARPQDPLTAPPIDVHGIRVIRGGAGYKDATADEVADLMARSSLDLDVLVLDCPPDLTNAQNEAVFSLPVDLVLALAQLEPGMVKLLQTLTGLCQRAGVPYFVLPNVEKGTKNAQVELLALRALYSHDVVHTTAAGAVPAMLAPIPSHEHVGASITKQVPYTLRKPGLKPPKGAVAAIATLAGNLVKWGIV